MLMNGKRLKVYVAGPYSAPTLKEREANVSCAIVAGISLFEKGHFPFIPHLSHFVDICTENLKWENYMQCDLAWLEVADAMFFIAPSPGANFERKYAENLGLEIFYYLEDVPEGIDGKHYNFAGFEG